MKIAVRRGGSDAVAAGELTPAGGAVSLWRLAARRTIIARLGTTVTGHAGQREARLACVTADLAAAAAYG